MATLTTVAKIQTALEQRQASVSDTTLITRLIDEVGADVGLYCNRRFLYEAYLEYFDGQGVDVCYLLNFPAIGITKVEYFSIKSSDVETWVEVEKDNYRTDITNGRIYYPAGFTAGFRNWRATYTSGYDAGSSPVKTVPQDLEGAVIDEVVCRFTAFQIEPMPVPEGSKLEDLRGRILSETAKRILDQYKIPALR